MTEADEKAPVRRQGNYMHTYLVLVQQFPRRFELVQAPTILIASAKGMVFKLKDPQ